MKKDAFKKANIVALYSVLENEMFNQIELIKAISYNAGADFDEFETVKDAEDAGYKLESK